MGFLSALAGPLVSGVLGSIGNKRASRQESQGAQAAAQASRPISVFGPQGSAEFDEDGNRLDLNLSPELLEAMQSSGALGQRQLNEFRDYNQNAQSTLEFQRLQEAREPSIAQARAQLQSQLLNRGRLGAAVGGGAGGRMFNPERAGLEEGIFRAQLGDYAQARDWATNYRNNLLGQASGLFDLSGRLGRSVNDEAALGVAGRQPTGIAALQAQPGFNKASTTRGFFSGLGTTLGNAVEDVDWTGAPRPATSHIDYYAPNGTGAR